MPAFRFSLGLAAVAVSFVGACASEDMPEASDGQALYMTYCAVCHAADGTGNGPMAAEMDPEPADLTLIAARNGGDFPVAQILSKIDGYAQGGTTGPSMPMFGDLFRGDLVPLDTGDGVMTPTPRKLVALLEYIESIQVAE
ncbi:c-type cytochrome [Marivita hallyeonensis]|uniref:Cytochrome c n=1 Tax=Marivita hallyeonensis TaxID=996342 RepID=A0A1M5P0S4_9RHOB|nr:cytochrome c [Marivita hallyeonensis]SHG94803.1 Cytochrome c [Marivita hallyeonensis]